MEQGTILYVGNFELPDKGASANRVMNNRLLFRECGFRTAFLGVTREETFTGIRQSEYDPDCYERAYPSSAKIWLERSYSLKDIQDVMAKYEDIRAVMFYNAPFALVRRACRYFHKQSVRVLYDCTEWNAYTDGSLPKRLYKKWDTRQIISRLDKFADGMIVISSLMEQNYVKTPTVLLPPLVDTEDSIWHREKAGHGDCFEFCYAGDPENKDDLCRLIDGFLQLSAPETYLRIIGVEREAFCMQNPAYTDLCREDGRIVFTGRLSHEAVIRQLLETDCFIFARDSNRRNNAGFPTKFAEAYTAGTRVIATDISDIRRYEAEGVILCDPAAQDGVMRAMRDALTAECNNGLRTAFDYRNYVGIAGHFLLGITEHTRGNTK